MGGEGTGIRLAALGTAWLGGVALQLQQAAPWSLQGYVGMALAALALVVLARRGFVAWPLALAALGFAIAGGHAALRLAEVLPDGLEKQDVVVTGIVAELPRISPDGVRFVFDVEDAARDGEPLAVPRRLSLGWYRAFRDDAEPAAGPQHDVRAGQRWRLTVRLKPPHGGANPHGFDAELWLFEQGIRATGTVRTARDAVNERLDDAAAHPVERLRQRIRDAIFAGVADERAAGVLAALAIGDQGSIERGDWSVFRDTGTAHLMAISGLHVTMFAWLAGAAAARLWRRTGRWVLLRVPAPSAARWCGVGAAAAYALLAGWGVPAQRTVWMLAVVALLRSRAVHWPWPLVLLAAAGVVTVFDPWALLQAGFWLSFVAVGLLMASEPAGGAPSTAAAASGWLGRTGQALRGGLRTQAVATIGLAPLTIVIFQALSIVGFLANLVAIPLVTLVVTPLALLGALAPPLWSAGAWVVGELCIALDALAALPWAVWIAPVAPPWAQWLGLLAGALLVMPLPWRLRMLGVPLLLPLLWPVVPRPAEGRFEVVAADVGQGNAVLVRTRAHLMVYDTGPAYSADSDAGERVLLPLLRARGERRVHTLVLSHRDADHVGGAASLIRGTRVDAIVGSIEEAHPLRDAGVPFTECAAGQHWDWDGVRFEVLHPEAFDPAVKPNTQSCVVRVQGADGASVLLAGDLEASQETDLVAEHGQALKSDVLLVPHHGSKTSSTGLFLDVVAPKTAVVQAGFRNRFGHPAPVVVERYAARGIALVDSPSCGAWTWRGGEGTCERERAARYWHHRPAPPLP
jgi:competence protein ComEC